MSKIKNKIIKIIHNIRISDDKNTLDDSDELISTEEAVDQIYVLFGWLPIEQIENNNLFDEILNVEVRLWSPQTGMIQGRLRKYLSGENVGYEWYYGKGSQASLYYFECYQRILYPEES